MYFKNKYSRSLEEFTEQYMEEVHHTWGICQAPETSNRCATKTWQQKKYKHLTEFVICSFHSGESFQEAENVQ